uniref:Selenium-binding protein 1 n=1 Tax=Ornithodoros moubata TaxID=6938 RepID=A0A1Z5KYI2_ORNMO
MHAIAAAAHIPVHMMELVALVWHQQSMNHLSVVVVFRVHTNGGNHLSVVVVFRVHTNGGQIIRSLFVRHDTWNVDQLFTRTFHRCQRCRVAHSAAFLLAF